MTRLTNILLILMVMRFSTREIANLTRMLSLTKTMNLIYYEPDERTTNTTTTTTSKNGIILATTTTTTTRIAASSEDLHADPASIARNNISTINPMITQHTTPTANNNHCWEWRAANWSAFQSSDLWHTHSACCFSKFVLAGCIDCIGTNIAWPLQGVDCRHAKDAAIDVHNMHLLQNGDSLYVQLSQLHYFVDNVLPKLNVSIVLFSTSWKGNIWSTPVNSEEIQLRDRLAKALVSSDKVAHMFLTNPPYAHPKMSGIPLGLKLKWGTRKINQLFTKYVDQYWELALSLTEADIQKRHGLYLGHLSVTDPSRQSLSGGERIPFPSYLRQMSQHEYILSPCGVKPDCYRNWEAIGLGVVPVSNINSTLHSFTHGAILDANMTEFNATRYPECGLSNCSHSPIVRDQILLPYWLDHFQCLVQSRYGMQIKYRETAQIAKLIRQ